MVEKEKDIVSRMMRCANAIYLEVDKAVADDVAAIILLGIGEINRLRKENKTLVQREVK